MSGLHTVVHDAQCKDAFQHLARCVAFKRFGYRPYDHELIQQARQRAQRVLETGRAEALPPMNAFERRMVHAELSSLAGLQTQSIGTEPNRRIVIKRAGF